MTTLLISSFLHTISKMKSILQEAHAQRRQRQQSKWSRLIFQDSLQILPEAQQQQQTNTEEIQNSSSASASTSVTHTPLSLILVERVGETIGSIVWEGCAALMAFLLHQEKQLRNSQAQNPTTAAASSTSAASPNSYSSLRGKRVIELGAGVGILGCLASKLGAREVLITDRQEILHVIRQNIEANHLLEANAKAEELEWGDNKIPDGLKPPFDVILASDVVYNLDAAWLLLETLKLICDSQTIVYLAYRQRDPKEQQWFVKAALDFDFETVTSSLPQDWDQHFVFQSIADPTHSNAGPVTTTSSMSPSSNSSTSQSTTQTAAQRYQNEHRPLTIFRMQKKSVR